MTDKMYTFRPVNVGRIVLWTLFALVLLVALTAYKTSPPMTSRSSPTKTNSPTTRTKTKKARVTAGLFRLV